MNEILAPRRLSDVIDLLEREPSIRAIGGGTTVVPDMRAGRLRAGRWLSTGSIDGLDAIRLDRNGMLRIGAAATFANIAKDGLVVLAAGLLVEALRAIASPALRNVATIGGSIAVAASSPDPATALVALGARVELVAPGRRRASGVDERGEARLIVHPIEAVTAPETPPPRLVTAVLIPTSADWAYERATVRGANDRPIVTVAVARDPTTRRRRIALGGLVGGVILLSDAEVPEGVGDDLDDVLRAVPVVDDDRATPNYRRRMAAVLIRRAIARLGRAALD